MAPRLVGTLARVLVSSAVGTAARTCRRALLLVSLRRRVSGAQAEGLLSQQPQRRPCQQWRHPPAGLFRWQVLPTPFAIYADGIDHVVFEEFGAGEMARNLKTEVEQNALFKDEAYRRKFRKFYAEKFSPRVWQRDFGDAIILECPEPSYVGRDFADIADEKGMHVVDLFLDLMVEYGRKLRWFTVIGNHRVEKLRAMVSNPDTLITFSDAGAHIRNMSFYNLPLRFLQLIKQSIDEGAPTMDIERAVHRLTGEQARYHDRLIVTKFEGVIKTQGVNAILAHLKVNKSTAGCALRRPTPTLRQRVEKN